MTFCSSFPVACADSSSAGVTRLPASQTREKFGDAMSSRKRCRPVWPVAPKMSAVFGAFVIRRGGFESHKQEGE